MPVTTHHQRAKADCAARTLGSATEAGTLRWAAVQCARHDIVKADRTGTPTLLMTLLDRLGMGFTS